MRLQPWRGIGRVVACVALGTLGPEAAAAQLAPRPQQGGWPPVEIGARVGYDNVQRQEVVGMLLRIPVLPNRTIELVPSADVTFLRGFKEYQFNADAVYVFAAADGGLYAGGGIGLRSTFPPVNPPQGRQTITTFAVVAGLKLTNLNRVNPMIEFRRIFASELVVDPQLFSIGVTFELW
jgi:hypothetical protein